MAARRCMIAALSAVVAASVCADEPLPEPFAKGTQVGHRVCETYLVGSYESKARSLICDLAARPAALVYFRALDPAVEKLLTKLDSVARQGAAHKMISSCVFLTDQEDDKQALVALAKRTKLEATIVTSHRPNDLELYFGGNPRPRSLSKDAVVSVVIFQKLKIQSSHAFRKGELTDRKISEIVNALAALLPPIKI